MCTHRFEDTGLENLYTAELVESGGDVQVFCVSLDAMDLPHRITLVKVDVEGHELSVIRGMANLLERYHPILIVEDNDPAVPTFLANLGYRNEKLPSSPNRMYRHGTSGVAEQG
jgi:cephalosporin hydroxylase